jgi:hypothetical protein
MQTPPYLAGRALVEPELAKLRAGRQHDPIAEEYGNTRNVLYT